MKSFLLALRFLTRLPVPDPGTVSNTQLGRSVLYYPLVGLTIGGMLMLSSFLVQSFSVNIQAAAILSFWVLLTGGLHLDGLADCTDAWIGGMGDKQRSLTIMKDPAAGPMAVVMLVLLLLMKWTLIAESLINNAHLLLLWTPAVGRLSILGLMLTAPYVRKEGMGEKLVRSMPGNPARLILILGVTAAALFVGMLPAIAGVGVFLMVRAIAAERLGGATGDVYGACVELTEVTVLMAAVSQ